MNKDGLDIAGKAKYVLGRTNKDNSEVWQGLAVVWTWFILSTFLCMKCTPTVCVDVVVG
jgi:hypothetical protein